MCNHSLILLSLEHHIVLFLALRTSLFLLHVDLKQKRILLDILFKRQIICITRFQN